MTFIYLSRSIDWPSINLWCSTITSILWFLDFMLIHLGIKREVMGVVQSRVCHVWYVRKRLSQGKSVWGQYFNFKVTSGHILNVQVLRMVNVGKKYLTHCSTVKRGNGHCQIRGYGPFMCSVPSKVGCPADFVHKHLLVFEGLLEKISILELINYIFISEDSKQNKSPPKKW